MRRQPGFVRWCVAAAVLSLAALLPAPPLAEAAEQATDRLHGFTATLPDGWRARPRPYGLLLSDFEGFVLVRGTPKAAPAQVVAAFAAEAGRLSGGRARLFFKEVEGGLLLVVQGLRYPLELAHGIGDHSWALFSRQARTRLGAFSYDAAHLLVPGQNAVLAVSVYLPRDASSATRQAALLLLRSLAFLPPHERVVYSMQPVYDPLLGMVAVQVPVPEGYAFQGGVVPQGNVRHPAFSLSRGRSLLRRDVVWVNSGGVQSQFGANAQTRLTWNGNTATQAGAFCLTQKAQVPQFLLQLWRMETGAAWTLRSTTALAERSRVGQLLERVEEASRPKLTALPSMRGGQPFDLSTRLAVSATSGGLVRKAWVDVRSLGYRMQSFAAGSFNCDVYLQATVVQAEAGGLDRAMGTFLGVLLGVQTNPEWPVREAERSRAASRDQTRMVLEMIRQGQEFNTWMSRSWTNLLSDQTYVRDPATGEVFRVYKRSFETASFWRDPVFGGIFRSGEWAGRLTDVGGWRRLEESLSGLPGTWR